MTVSVENYYICACREQSLFGGMPADRDTYLNTYITRGTTTTNSIMVRLKFKPRNFIQDHNFGILRYLYCK